MDRGQPGDIRLCFTIYISQVFFGFFVCRRPQIFKTNSRYKKSVQVQLDTQNVNSKYAGTNLYREQPEYFAPSPRSVAEFTALYKCKYFRIKIIIDIALAESSVLKVASPGHWFVVQKVVKNCLGSRFLLGDCGGSRSDGAGLLW